MIFNDRKKNIQDSGDILYQINSKDLEITSSYTHIGVERNTEHGPVSDAAIATARKTLYSLMGAGLHGYNGVNPKVGIKMWNIYVKPRMLFSLESQKASKGDRAALNQYYKVFLKRIMQLRKHNLDTCYHDNDDLLVQTILDCSYLSTYSTPISWNAAWDRITGPGSLFFPVLPEVPDTRNAHVLVFLSTWTRVRAKGKYFLYFITSTQKSVYSV